MRNYWLAFFGACYIKSDVVRFANIYVCTAHIAVLYGTLFARGDPIKAFAAVAQILVYHCHAV